MYKPSRTWWGKEFLEILKISMDPRRLGRGKSYSTPQRILSFDIEGHEVNAIVRGNRRPEYGIYSEPKYHVNFHLKKFTNKQWDSIIDTISHNAAFISQLLIGEMPSEIETVFEKLDLNLLPRLSGELSSNCTCPDYASPCKHVAGLYYRIASMLDTDPLLLFQLRGMSFKRVEEKLSKSPLGKALIDLKRDHISDIVYQSNRYTTPSLESKETESITSFWQGKVQLIKEIQPNQENVSPAVLIKKGGEYPSFWHKGSSFISAMEDVYQRIIRDNKDSL